MQRCLQRNTSMSLFYWLDTRRAFEEGLLAFHDYFYHMEIRYRYQNWRKVTCEQWEWSTYNFRSKTAASNWYSRQVVSNDTAKFYYRLINETSRKSVKHLLKGWITDHPEVELYWEYEARNETVQGIAFDGPVHLQQNKGFVFIWQINNWLHLLNYMIRNSSMLIVERIQIVAIFINKKFDARGRRYYTFKK